MDNRSRQNMPTKCGDQAETNGGRRRKTLSKKVKRQSASEFQPQPAATCCMPQRLFPAVSDSAVSGYPLSMEQMLYPTVYHPMYPHPAMMAAIAPAPHLHTNPKYFNNSKQCSYHNAEYTSLPPDNVIQSDQQRRFSDPGLANGVDQSADDDSDHLSNANLVEKVDRLAKDNHRLQSELHDVRLQLQQLQLEMTGWKEAHPGYQPGMVSDLVCELREAMKVHQEAFLARLKQNTPQVNDRLTVKEFDDLKKKLNHVTTEKEDLNDRLKRLEEQMQTVMVHNSLQESNQQELVVLEQEKLKLRRELQEEIDARKAAESQFRSLEQVLGALRKKKVNGIVTLDVDKVEQRGGDGADHVTGVTATSSGESLMSSLGSGSMHSPHVTMSGPVTDL